MRRVWKAAAAAAVLTVTASSAATAVQPLPTPPKKGAFKTTVSQDLFGMHDHSLTTTPPGPSQRFGAVRMWDSGVRWDQINTAPGVYDWTVLDRVVANSQATGAADLMYVLGSTPEWAAKYVKPDFYYYGGGTGSVPKNMSDWTTWVRAVAERYKGKITTYQMWNEANLTQFFEAGDSDSAQAMADLTVAAEQVIREVDPAASVTTASSTVIQTKNYTKKSWFTRYLKALKAKASRPDSVSIHLYPWVNNTQGPGNGTLADRARGLDLAKTVMSKTGYGSYPVLDTEMNYGNLRDNGHPQKKYNQTMGAAYLAQTYLASLHNGVSQIYWYGWDDYVLGIWLTSKSGAVLKPGKAFGYLKNEISGAKNGGCALTSSVSTCVVRKGSAKQYWVFRPTKKAVTYSVPAAWKVKRACDVVGTCTKISKGKVSVGISPLQLKR